MSEAAPLTPGKVPENYTRFERARILGARALQISLGAPMLVELPPELVDPVTIAEMEFARGVIPITVRRSDHALAGATVLRA